MHPHVWNPRLHPRDRIGQFTDTPGSGSWLSRAAEQARRGFTDAELAQREQDVNDLIAGSRHLDTHRVHKPNGRWSDERAAAHREILDRVWAEKATRVPNQHRAVMTGGLMGAGKTTVLAGHPEIDMSDYLMVSADDMKEEIIRHGLVPQIPGAEHLSPMELSAMYHVESAYLADALAERAYAEGKNVILDASMGDRTAPAARLARLRDMGYQVRGVFVDIPVETSLERASARYRSGMQQWGSGAGPGGRTIPPALIEGQRGPGGMTKNRVVFDQLREEGLFGAGWEVHDNTGSAPVLLKRGGGIQT